MKKTRSPVGCFRLLQLAPLVLLLLLGPELALAFGVADIVIRKPDASTLENEFFNQGRCQCNGNLQVEIQLDLSNRTGGQRMKVVAGLSCLEESTSSIKANCAVLVEQTLITEITVNPLLSVPVQSLMGESCTGQQLETWNVFVYLSDPADQTKWTEAFREAITVDTNPPLNPKVNGVQAAEGGAKVSFTSATGSSGGGGDSGVQTEETGIKGYQVLCEEIDAAGQPIGPPPGSRPAPAFDTRATLCPTTVAADAGVADARPADAGVPDSSPTDLGVAEAGVAEAGAAVDARLIDQGRTPDAGSSGSSCARSLSPSCVCSEMTSSGTAEVRGLANGKSYRFYLVAIDDFRNPSEPVLAGEATPEPVEDLWERYRRKGGSSDGGYCFVATAAFGSYDHPQVRVLRAFRDRVLLRSHPGRLAVISYYLGGAAPAAWLERHPSARPVARALLWPVTLAAAGLLFTSTSQKLLMLALLAAAAWLWWRQRRRRRRGPAGPAGGEA